ncbi:hypothetical protein NDU88_001029 [Pleurodeles waltl]|uniref:Uncharacterized protein n=1 Tax=Pleurodeles waltl TaxID=8319 RepID=A0AAV7NHU8_PLEWA|nr:hypothetical protein NDU88_001029 [Pleurodeles waltl]
MVDTRPTASFQRTRSQQQETDMDRVAVRGKKSESLKKAVQQWEVGRDWLGRALGLMRHHAYTLLGSNMECNGM